MHEVNNDIHGFFGFGYDFIGLIFWAVIIALLFWFIKTLVFKK